MGLACRGADVIAACAQGLWIEGNNMNRRGFILGAGALAAPSIIGISGVIQLSRPALVVPPLDMLERARAAWMSGNSIGNAIGSAWADAVLFGRGAVLVGADGSVRRVDPFGPEAEKATILELAPSPFPAAWHGVG